MTCSGGAERRYVERPGRKGRAVAAENGRAECKSHRNEGLLRSKAARGQKRTEN